jgi:hypothetical protein
VELLLLHCPLVTVYTHNRRRDLVVTRQQWDIASARYAERHFARAPRESMVLWRTVRVFDLRTSISHSMTATPLQFDDPVWDACQVVTPHATLIFFVRIGRAGIVGCSDTAELTRSGVVVNMWTSDYALSPEEDQWTI